MEEMGHVESSTNNGIATITFGHPQSNSLPGSLLQLLAKTIKTTKAVITLRRAKKPPSGYTKKNTQQTPIIQAN